MVQKIRDQPITIKRVYIKIMIAMLIKYQHKGMGELEVKSSVFDSRGGDILKTVFNSFILQKGGIKILFPKPLSGK